VHVFSGQQFSKNPCVANAYFGQSLLGWVTNHFAKRVVECPVALLLDGHSTLVDVEEYKFCRDNQILLYCSPPHVPHYTTTSSGKNAWGKSSQQYGMGKV